MKKSRIALSVVCTLAIVGAVFTKVLAQPIAFIQSSPTLCEQVERPQGCVPQGEEVCTLLSVTYFQDVNGSNTQCITPFFKNGN